jgi:predicted transglutaminase-like cysteine proteinase
MDKQRHFANHNIGYCLFVFFFIQLSVEAFINPAMLERLKKDYGEAAHQRGIALNLLLNELSDQSEETKLTEVNRFFNQFKYKTDKEQWDSDDYWATPEEFIGLYAGDCEDYVIAKYFTLRALGIEEKKLYLTYVKATELNMAHMVLSYFETPKSIPLVLDSYELKILPADQRKDLLPVYSFNVGSLFLTNASAGLGKKLPTDKVKNSKWTELLKSIKASEQ